MASKYPREEQVQLRPRKGHDMKWICSMHDEPIAFYCKKHDVPICHKCATKLHQKPCGLDEIEDVIFERMSRLDDKQEEIEKGKKQLKMLDSKIESIGNFASNQLQKVYDKINSTHTEQKSSVLADEEMKIRLIYEEVYKESPIANEERDRRIKECNAETRKQQLIIKESHAKLLSELKAISEVVSQKINYLKSKNQQAISTMDNIDAKIKRIQQDDKTLVDETPQVLASLDENLIVHQYVSDCLDRREREVRRLKFVEGKVGGEHYGRIDGYIGKWEFVKSMHIPPTVDLPAMRGLIHGNNVCVVNVHHHITYVTNINTEHTQRVKVGHSGTYITSCAPLDSNVIVCGKGGRDCTGGRLDGCINLYDRKWKVIREISLPGNNRSNTVYVDVDMDGMIIAAQSLRSNIYVISPADGKIVNTITMRGKEVLGGIQALSSGDIVVKTGFDESTVISRSGEQKAVIYCDEWEGLQCQVDKLTDTLYITYWDTERNTYAVDQVSCDGIIQARRVVEYKASDRCDYISPCLVTPSGNLVACDGERLLVYKNCVIVGSTQSEGTDSTEPIKHALDGGSATGKFGVLGGNLYTKSHGFTLHIPPGALEKDEIITLRVLTEIPNGLTLKEDEFLVSHGYQCYPSGLSFKKSARLIIPHCALVTDPNKVQTILYSCDQSDTPERISDPHNIICSVKERWLEVSISHFSGGWITVLWNWLFLKGILLSCMPFLPRLMPPSRKPLLEVRFVKKPHDRKWNDVHSLDDPFFQPVKGDDDDIVFEEGILTVACHRGEKRPKSDVHTIEYRYTDMRLETKVTEYFMLDLTEESDETLVTLQVMQSSLKTIQFNTRFQGFDKEATGQTALSAAIDAIQSDEQKVTDANILKLARLLPPNLWNPLHVALCIDFGTAEGIRREFREITEQYIHLLQTWKAASTRTRKDLNAILIQAEAGGFVDKY